ncbi:ACE [Cordylochernes scorpioides]|uniref:Angiotensin-converting enzyme n=1 Tax=Cordylochernes scorpioides TaxID=51811 RepID=A0ABY6JXN6_9ARAC|nr:ACE [Cordylochernes scorpioides]
MVREEWRDPTVFSGERGEDSQRWLSDFQRVARYNKWDDSMCLANVIFYLTGTAKCWFENFEEILNSWEEFKIKFCEIFGNKETARKAENILRTRAQTSGENVESYIQEVLLLCKQGNPRMSEGEKVSHLIKGVAEEVYQALVGKDISTVDQFVAFCRRFEAFKRMRVAPPRFNRLPNVTTISTAEPENLEALIRRIVREEVQKFMAPPSTFAAQDIDTPPPDLRDVIRSEIQQTLAPISAPRRQYLPQNDQGYRRRTEGPPNNQRTQWRTEDDRPICFHCGRPGHVARYCRDRRQAFADARLGRETVDFGRPRTENYTMGESGSELSQGRFRNPSPYHHRGRFQAPRRTSQSPARRPSRSPSRRNGAPSGGVAATDENLPCRITATMEKNWISVNIQGRNVQALVDSGADYSVISEAFRRFIKAPVFKENGPLLRTADKKPIVTLGKCSLEVQIKGLYIIFYFVVAAECSHDSHRCHYRLWEKLYSSEAEKSYEWKDLELCAAMDCVLPPKSFGKIVVTNQDVFGSRDVVVTGSKRLQLEKGLFIPSSLVRFLHGRAVLWVTNSTHQSQVIPSDMKVGTMQDLEVGSISNLDACSEIAGKDEVTSPDVRECLISMISTDLEETKKNRLLTCLNEFADIFDFEKKSFPVSGKIKHKIDTSDYPPIRQRPYRVSPAERRVIQSEVEKMMETKIIWPSSSPWASPVILVRKKDGSLRFSSSKQNYKERCLPSPSLDPLGAGFNDRGELWREPFESLTFEDDMAEQWEIIRPFYLEMHAYVRMKLVKFYGEKVVKPDGPIPAHLLGNMWGEGWIHLQDITRPFPDKQDVDITPEMVRRNLTAIQMFKISEDFFTSLGMKRMTPEFWHYSVIEEQEVEAMECYTMAWRMCADDDFRLWHCTVPTQEDLVLVHHMMGNIQYYQHYANQLDVFQWGANPGFHEAIGEVLELSVVTPKHLHKIGFLDKVENDTEVEINFLMSLALEKIAFMPFSYLIDLWRWDVFRGSVDNLNDRWWQLRQQYQGLCPPVRRSENDFDPGANNHVPGNTPQIRHFFSYILQFQLQEVLCREAGHVGPLHTCDIYGSHAAGDKLAGLLRLGSSMPWQDALARMTGGSGKLDARPLLNYFAPLRRHIRDSLGNSTVGWTSGDHNICP